MSVASMSIQQLLEQRTLIDTQICLKTGGSISGSITKGVKLNKSGKPKKVSTRKGVATANGDFMKKVHAEQAAAFEEFKLANPEKKQGAHMVFYYTYRDAHEDEWKAFEAAWNEAHPKDQDAASDDGNTMVTAASSEKPKRVMTPEHKEKLKAGREAAKAAKDAAKAAAAGGFSATTVVVATPSTPAVASPATKKPKKVTKKAEAIEPVVISSNTSVVEEDDAPELIPFKHGGMTYMRLGNKREDGNHLWATADLWGNKKGAKGDYVGTLEADGTIDQDALEPLLD